MSPIPEVQASLAGTLRWNLRLGSAYHLLDFVCAARISPRTTEAGEVHAARCEATPRSPGAAAAPPGGGRGAGGAAAARGRARRSVGVAQGDGPWQDRFGPA